MTTSGNSQIGIGENFVAALARKDWAAVESILHKKLTFRALIPPGLRGATASQEAAGYFQQWFGEAKPLELQIFDVRVMLDRLHIFYRFRARENRWYLVEQQLYCSVSDGCIDRIDLLCSGFRPE